MRLSDVNDLRLQQLADQHREIASRRIDPAIFEELIDRRAGMSPMQLCEKTLAYERAAGVLVDNLVQVAQSGDYVFFDLETEEENFDDEVAYLTSRRLIHRHPGNDNWIAICDEGEPLPDDGAV